MVAGDEASVYLQATLMRGWAKKGQTPLVRVSASRDNTHFYGALNLATGRETVLRSQVMNSEVSALFLQSLFATYPDVPRLLLWDRAPWHKGASLQAVLEANPRLEGGGFRRIAPSGTRRSLSGRQRGKPSVITMRVRRWPC